MKGVESREPPVPDEGAQRLALDEGLQDKVLAAPRRGVGRQGVVLQANQLGDGARRDIVLGPLVVVTRALEALDEVVMATHGRAVHPHVAASADKFGQVRLFELALGERLLVWTPRSSTATATARPVGRATTMF